MAFLQNAVGAVPSPFDAFLTLRGIKTLAVRMERHCGNAMHIAAFLEQHPKVQRVIYPGLASHPQHLLAVCDNTFASPWIQRPLEHGFDIVVHSTTKYINGHSDVIGGAAIIRQDEVLKEKLAFLQNAVGGVPSPFDAFLTLRGIKTLALRMERHCQNAVQIAEWLEKHPKIEKVLYPGLASHPQHALARRQMNGRYGGMVTAVLKGGLERSRRFLERCKLFTLAESLGGVESLIEHPAIMTHASLPEDVRAELGIDAGLVRLSVGIENVDDLIAELKYALE